MCNDYSQLCENVDDWCYIYFYPQVKINHQDPSGHICLFLGLELSRTVVQLVFVLCLYRHPIEKFLSSPCTDEQHLELICTELSYSELSCLEIYTVESCPGFLFIFDIYPSFCFNYLWLETISRRIFLVLNPGIVYRDYPLHNYSV
jgi:hypothetical protein